MAISSIFYFFISSSYTSHMKKTVHLLEAGNLLVHWNRFFLCFIERALSFFRVLHVRVGFLLIGCIKQPVGHGAMKIQKSCFRALDDGLERVEETK